MNDNFKKISDYVFNTLFDKGIILDTNSKVEKFHYMMKMVLILVPFFEPKHERVFTLLYSLLNAGKLDIHVAFNYLTKHDVSQTTINSILEIIVQIISVDISLEKKHLNQTNTYETIVSRIVSNEYLNDLYKSNPSKFNELMEEIPNFIKTLIMQNGKDFEIAFINSFAEPNHSIYEILLYLVNVDNYLELIINKLLVDHRVWRFTTPIIRSRYKRPTKACILNWFYGICLKRLLDKSFNSEDDKNAPQSISVRLCTILNEMKSEILSIRTVTQFEKLYSKVEKKACIMCFKDTVTKELLNTIYSSIEDIKRDEYKVTQSIDNLITHTCVIEEILSIRNNKEFFVILKKFGNNFMKSLFPIV